MPYTILISDECQRNAAVSAIGPRRARQRTSQQTADGRRPEHQRLIKSSERTAFAVLLRAHHGDLAALGAALVAGDPEVPLELLGSSLEDATRIHLKADGNVLYAARTLRVVCDPDGTELSSEDFVDVEATVVGDGSPLPWTGQLLDPAEVVRRYALVRKLQLRHVDGLTFDVLFGIARSLHEAGKLLLMGSGTEGAAPLIFTRNGAPYRGFLEGRIDGDRYRLVLHLSNLEIEAPAAPAEED